MKLQEVDGSVIINKENFKEWRDELQHAYNEMQEFYKTADIDILQKISSYTARASYIRWLLNRSTSGNCDRFRTREIDPFLTECDRQFKIWSRIISTKQMELEMSR